MDDYAKMSALQAMDKQSVSVSAQMQKPRLASLIDRLSQLNNQAIEIVGTASGELDRIIGMSPSNSASSLPGPCAPVNCAIAELDGLVDDLSSKLSAIGREVNRLRGL